MVLTDTRQRKVEACQRVASYLLDSAEPLHVRDLPDFGRTDVSYAAGVFCHKHYATVCMVLGRGGAAGQVCEWSIVDTDEVRDALSLIASDAELAATVLWPPAPFKPVPGAEPSEGSLEAATTDDMYEELQRLHKRLTAVQGGITELAAVAAAISAREATDDMLLEALIANTAALKEQATTSGQQQGTLSVLTKAITSMSEKLDKVMDRKELRDIVTAIADVRERVNRSVTEKTYTVGLEEARQFQKDMRLFITHVNTNIKTLWSALNPALDIIEGKVQKALNSTDLIPTIHMRELGQSGTMSHADHGPFELPTKEQYHKAGLEERYEDFVIRNLAPRPK